MRPRWLCAAEDVMPVIPDDLELFLATADSINDAGLREELHELPPNCVLRLDWNVHPSI